MIWFFTIVVVAVLTVVAFVAAGKGGAMVEEYDDRPDALVPADRPLRADDLRRVRFSIGFRGYRMSEVDALLDRLAIELDDARPGPSGTGADLGSDPGSDLSSDLDSDIGTAAPTPAED